MPSIGRVRPRDDQRPALTIAPGAGPFRSRTAFLGRFVTERGVLGTVGLMAFLGLWELGSRLRVLNPIVFSSPTGVIGALEREIARGEIWQHLGVSILEFTVGFFLAAVVGIFVGLLAGASTVVLHLLDPWITLLYSTPKVALIPMIIIVMGIDLPSKVFIVFLMSVFVVIVNTLTGVQNTSRNLIAVGRVFGARRRMLWTSVVLPSALPNILAGLRLSGMHAMVGVVVAELVAGNHGIGFMISQAGASLRTGTVMLLVLFLGLWGVVFGEVMRAVEGRFEPWRPMQKA